MAELRELRMEIGNSVVGIYKRDHHNEGVYQGKPTTFTSHLVASLDGKVLYKIPSSARLKRAMEMIEQGKQVKITRIADVPPAPGKGGSPAKDYALEFEL